MINVTKPFFPPLEEYTAYLEEIWKRGWITNNGPVVNELELKLKEYLGVDHMLYTGNGTIAIQIALRALDVKGEVITTPFSYVATLSSIVWENLVPVFVDIDEDTLNIDPKKIEAAVTENTSAILATHCFGNPCDIDAIQAIADRHGLKVIYDAAHCFGTTYKGKSVYAYGDASTASFHATKVFHTAEGGAIFAKSPEVLKRMAFMRNFGHYGPYEFQEIGINGKNSELHAALGLVNLKYVDTVLKKKKELSLHYHKVLAPLKHKKIKINNQSVFNHSYYPVILESESQLIRSVEMLNANGINPRRYFYPSLNTVPYVGKANMPISESISSRILCLPLFDELTEQEVELIAEILTKSQHG